MPEKVETWLGGWAIPPEWALSVLEKHFPGQRHQWLPPTAHNLVMGTASAGYSLGASLLLRQNPGTEANLYAPFLDFKKEAGQGGKVARAQLLYVRKWLQKDPLAAINDFYRTAGLPIVATNLPYPLEDLLWGLAQLLEDVPLPAQPLKALAKLGGEDALLDNARLGHYFERATLAKGATHNLDELLEQTHHL